MRASDVGPVGAGTGSGAFAAGGGRGGGVTAGGGVLQPLNKPKTAVPKPNKAVVTLW